MKIMSDIFSIVWFGRITFSFSDLTRTPLFSGNNVSVIFSKLICTISIIKLMSDDNNSSTLKNPFLNRKPNTGGTY